MRAFLFSATAALALTAGMAPAMADNCYDLWYERNQIYDDNGFCFKTQLGRDTFDNSDCYTSNPSFSRAEVRRVAQIKARERAKHCHVN